MSDDPARNDILRLDEMMSRKPVGSILINLLFTLLVFVIVILLQITGVTLMRPHAILTGLLCCLMFYSQRRPG